MREALESAQRVRTIAADGPDDDVRAEKVKALAVARAVLTLGTYRAQAEKVSDDLLWNAIKVWPKNLPKWGTLNKLAKALGCGAASDEGLRTQMGRKP
ncbi:hypothetical protein BH11MYX4_BH11MYX4_23850 [soil metagenome]